MPVACPHCGTENSEGVHFCQNCRTPLMAGPLPHQAREATSTSAASPFYTPTGSPPPVHRLSTTRLIGGGIALFILLSILATLITFIIGTRSVPTHATAESSPTASPSPNRGVIDTDTFSMGLAPGFRSVRSDGVSALVANGTGTMYVTSGKQGQESSIETEFTGIVDNLEQRYSQIAQCSEPADFTIDGVKGTLWGFSYLFAPQGARATRVCDLFFISVPQSDRTIFYEVEMFMADSEYEKFVSGSAMPELATIHWKAVN